MCWTPWRTHTYKILHNKQRLDEQLETEYYLGQKDKEDIWMRLSMFQTIMLC